MQKMIEFLRAKQPSSQMDISGIENLCPYCYSKVEGFPKTCSECHGMFKSANKAGWLSLIFPGFGDFYIGHRKFAILEILGTAFIWINLFIPAEGETEPLGFLDYLLGAIFIVVFIHGIDALVTRYTGRKGIYPKDIRRKS